MSDALHSSGWPENFFGDPARGKPRPFAPDVREFLSHPIQFKDRRGHPVYLWLDTIEPVETPVDYQLLLEFQVRDEPPPPTRQPRLGKISYSGEVNEEASDEGEDDDGAVLVYPFTSLNSFAKNRANLRDFALSNWERPNTLPRMRGERFDRSRRVE